MTDPTWMALRYEPYLPSVAEWRASGQMVKDLGRWYGDESLAGQRGRVYAADDNPDEMDGQGTGVYVEALSHADATWGAPCWRLTLERSDYHGTLEELEPRLYAWWCDEAGQPMLDYFREGHTVLDGWRWWRPVEPVPPDFRPSFSVPFNQAPIVEGQGYE